ncbi:hypothetical protein D9M71_829860 [compost metagenome]
MSRLCPNRTLCGSALFNDSLDLGLEALAAGPGLSERFLLGPGLLSSLQQGIHQLSRQCSLRPHRFCPCLGVGIALHCRFPKGFSANF